MGRGPGTKLSGRLGAKNDRARAECPTAGLLAWPDQVVRAGLAWKSSLVASHSSPPFLPPCYLTVVSRADFEMRSTAVLSLLAAGELAGGTSKAPPCFHVTRHRGAAEMQLPRGGWLGPASRLPLRAARRSKDHGRNRPSVLRR